MRMEGLNGEKARAANGTFISGRTQDININCQPKPEENGNPESPKTNRCEWFFGIRSQKDRTNPNPFGHCLGEKKESKQPKTPFPCFIEQFQ